MNTNHPNTPMSLRMEPGVGSNIGDCFDQAMVLVQRLSTCVVFDFNEVHCGVRPCDAVDPAESRTIFINNFHRELGNKNIKICYANP